MAQTVPTFSKIFNDSSYILSGGISIASFNDSIYFSLFEQGQPNNYQTATFIKTDPNGNQIDSIKPITIIPLEFPDHCI